MITLHRTAQTAKLPRRWGQGLVEFALVLPLLLVLLFGIIEMARMFYAWLAVQNAARSGVRYAVTGQFETQYCDDATNFYLTHDISGTVTSPGYGYLLSTEVITVANPTQSTLTGCVVSDTVKTSTLQNWARLVSIANVTRGGAPAIQANYDNVGVSGDYLGLIQNPSGTFSDTTAYRGNPGASEYFNIVICSNRATYQRSPRYYPGHEGDDRYRYPDPCMARGAYMDDAGDNGNKVTVSVTFRHPLITPILTGWWPDVKLTAERTGQVETFRKSREVVLSSGEPGGTTDTPTPTTTLTPSNTPTRTNSPTPSNTPTRTTTPSITTTATRTYTATPTNTRTRTNTPTMTMTPNCTGYAIAFDSLGTQGTTTVRQAVNWDLTVPTGASTNITVVQLDWAYYDAYYGVNFRRFYYNAADISSSGSYAPATLNSSPLTWTGSYAALAGTYTLQAVFANTAAWPADFPTYSFGLHVEFANGCFVDTADAIAPTPTITPTPSNTSTRTNTPTRTNTSTPSRTSTPSNTPTITNTPTRSNTPTNTPTRTNTPTITNTPTRTPTVPTNTPTRTNTPSNTPTRTPTVPTNTPTRTNTPSNTPTRTPTEPTHTPTYTNTPRPPTNTPTRTSTPSNTATEPTHTPTYTTAPTRTNTPTATEPTHTPTRTATSTLAATATRTPSPTFTLPPD